MTSSADSHGSLRRAPDPGLLHRRPRQVRDHRAVRDAPRPPRRSTCPAQGAAVLRHRSAYALSAASDRDRCRRPWRSTSRCSPAPRPSSRRGRPPRYISGRSAAALDRGAPARGADHRDPARAGELPALAAPAVAPEPHRVRARPAHGDRARGRRGGKASAFRPARCARRRCSTPTTFATSSSCAATTRCSPRSRSWC